MLTHDVVITMRVITVDLRWLDEPMSLNLLIMNGLLKQLLLMRGIVVLVYRILATMMRMLLLLLSKL